MRCALVNVGDNAWNIVAAVYWTMKGVGEEATVKEYLDIGYEWICTCQKDAQKLVDALGGGASEEGGSGDPYGMACSEKAATNKADAEEERENKILLQAEAKAEAERIAEAEAAAAAAKEELLGLSAADLEAKQIEAFEKYQTFAEELAAQETPSDEDKQELERLRREYEATKTAKADIVRNALST